MHLDDLADLLTDLLQSAPALAPLLPHLASLALLTQRLLAVAQAAAQADPDALSHELRPLVDDAHAHLHATLDALLQRDALLLEALEQLGAAVDRVAADPRALKTLDALRQRALDGADGALRALLDHALDARATPHPHLTRAAAVAKALLGALLERVLTAALLRRSDLSAPPTPR